MTDIHVFENNAPLLTIRIKKKLPDGSRVPYILTGAPAVTLYVKNRRSDADGSAKFSLTKTAGDIVITNDGSGVGATYGEITIQCKSADLTPYGSYPFHLDVIKSGKPETVMTGNFVIENT